MAAHAFFESTNQAKSKCFNPPDHPSSKKGETSMFGHAHAVLQLADELSAVEASRAVLAQGLGRMIGQTARTAR